MSQVGDLFEWLKDQKRQLLKERGWRPSAEFYKGAERFWTAPDGRVKLESQAFEELESKEGDQ